MWDYNRHCKCLSVSSTHVGSLYSLFGSLLFSYTSFLNQQLSIWRKPVWSNEWVWRKPMVELESYTQKPDDVGTRYVHYTELLELWEDGLELLIRQDEYSHCKKTTDQIAIMEASIATLKMQIDVMCGYKKFSLRYGVITDIPEKIEDIKGGRGTPLKSDDQSHWHTKD